MAEPSQEQHTVPTGGGLQGQGTVLMQSRRRHLFPRAALVGFLAGGLAVAFRLALAGGEAWRERLIAWAQRFPAWGWLVPMLWGALGAGLAVTLVWRFAPAAAGSGIPHLKAVLYRLRSMPWATVLPVKFFGGVLAIGGGLALGREGPTVQMGGAVGAAVAQGLRSPPRERQTLIAAGAGAGLAAAFNAPLAGVAFVLEEVQQYFAPTVFGAAFVAALLADVVARSWTGQLPVFHVSPVPPPPLLALPAFLGVGVLAGLLGVTFNRSLLATLELLSRLRRWPAGLLGALVGAAVGLLGWWVPEALGGAPRLIDTVLAGQMPLAHIPLWFLLRFGLTMVSYGCGAPGGIFAPLLLLGMLLGLGVGQVVQWILPGVEVAPQAFAVVGMGAYFAAIVRAPLTGVVLIVEMTNSYDQMLPLLVACFAAYTVADLLVDRPIYEAMLERDLRQEARPHTEDGPFVLEYIVHDGATFDGKTVQELGLPAGCVLVTLHRGRAEHVPTATTRLEAGDRLTAVIAPAAAEAIALLRAGCAPPHSPGKLSSPDTG